MWWSRANVQISRSFKGSLKTYSLIILCQCFYWWIPHCHHLQSSGHQRSFGCSIKSLLRACLVGETASENLHCFRDCFSSFPAVCAECLLATTPLVWHLMSVHQLCSFFTHFVRMCPFHAMVSFVECFISALHLCQVVRGNKTVSQQRWQPVAASNDRST